MSQITPRPMRWAYQSCCLASQPRVRRAMRSTSHNNAVLRMTADIGTECTVEGTSLRWIELPCYSVVLTGSIVLYFRENIKFF